MASSATMTVTASAGKKLKKAGSITKGSGILHKKMMLAEAKTAKASKKPKMMLAEAKASKKPKMMLAGKKPKKAKK